jgi:hypothetical protein
MNQKLQKSFDLIHEKVAEYYDINVADLTDLTKRQYHIANARYVCWGIASQVLGYGLTRIAKYYGRSVSTIQYGIYKVQDTKKLMRAVKVIVDDYGEMIAPTPETTLEDFQYLINIQAKRMMERGESYPPKKTNKTKAKIQHGDKAGDKKTKSTGISTGVETAGARK